MFLNLNRLFIHFFQKWTCENFFVSKVNIGDQIGRNFKPCHYVHMEKIKNRSLRGHVLTGNECYTINIVHVIVDMLL